MLKKGEGEKTYGNEGSTEYGGLAIEANKRALYNAKFGRGKH